MKKLIGYVSIGDLCVLFGVERSTVWRWARDYDLGAVYGIDVRGAVYYRYKGIVKWAKDNSVEMPGKSALEKMLKTEGVI